MGKGAASRGKSRRGGGRAFVVIFAGILASELVGLVANVLASGHYSLDQLTGFVAALAGPVVLMQGDQRARFVTAGFFFLLAAYGAYHMATTPHRVSVHSVTLVTQSLIRLGVGVLLLTPVAVRFVQSHHEWRRGQGK